MIQNTQFFRTANVKKNYKANKNKNEIYRNEILSHYITLIQGFAVFCGVFQMLVCCLSKVMVS